MKIKPSLYRLVVICFLLISYSIIYAENITEAEYAEMASKFYSWELGPKNIDALKTKIYTLNMSRALESFTQIHEYSITQDNNNQTYISKILIIAKDNIYSAMPSYIIRYAHDIHNAFGCSVDIVSVNGETAPQVRSLIQSYSSNLNGVVLVGDIIPSIYYIPQTTIDTTIWAEDYFPCDLYYMDLNGSWHLRTNGGGEYDGHTWDVKPEVFVGRINTAGMGRNEIQELKNYFDKNHKYWTGKKALNKKFAATYTYEDWNNMTFWHSVAPLYGNNNYHVYTALAFNKPHYLSCLQNNDYEFIQLACHSDETAHYFKKLSTGSWIKVKNDDIFSRNIRQIGYNLFCCHACNWITSDTCLCLGESYLFGQNNNSETLAIIGSTKSGGMLGFEDFYTSLGNGKCIGQAFKEWWINHCGSTHDTNEKIWSYGMVVLGDPLIDFNFTNDCDNVLYLNGEEEIVNGMYYAQSKIIVQNYSLTQGQSITLSAHNIQISGPFLCNSSSTFIANPKDSCVCNNNRSNSEDRNNIKNYSNPKPSQTHSFDLTVYPNPTKDVITADINEEVILLVIYNQRGNYVLQTQELNINVSHLPSGVYMIQVFTKDGHSRQGKFIKL